MMPLDAPEDRAPSGTSSLDCLVHRNFPLVTKLKEKEEYATREAGVGAGPSALLSARI